MRNGPDHIADADEQNATAPAETVTSLYERLKKPILALGFQMLGDTTLAEDVLQETFLLVQRHLAQFRGEADVSTWVYRIAIRVAARLRNNQRKEVTVRRRHVELGSTRPDDARTPLEANEECRQLYAAMDTLPDDHRAVLTLLSIRAIPVREVAMILGIPEGTVWSRAHHARRKLREALDRSDQPSSP